MAKASNVVSDFIKHQERHETHKDHDKNEHKDEIEDEKNDFDYLRKGPKSDSKVPKLRSKDNDGDEDDIMKILMSQKLQVYNTLNLVKIFL